MLRRSTGWTKQEEEVLSRRTVRGSQIDAVFQTDKNDLRLRQRLQIAMRNGDRVTNRRRDNPFPLEKNLDDGVAFFRRQQTRADHSIDDLRNEVFNPFSG
jgi:3'-phosphoadenosine 5'-phosphosulfate sulfotransferase